MKLSNASVLFPGTSVSTRLVVNEKPLKKLSSGLLNQLREFLTLLLYRCRRAYLMLMSPVRGIS